MKAKVRLGETPRQFMSGQGQKLAREIADHLKAQFGSYSGCLHCCGVVIPPVGSVLEVLELLEPCHDTSHGGLDNGLIPPGIYRVMEVSDIGTTSHFMTMQRVGADEKLYFNAGYRNECCVDWRYVRNANKA